MLNLVVLVVMCSVLGTWAIPNDTINLLKLMELRHFGLDFYKNISYLESIASNKSIEMECVMQLRAIENGLQKRDLWSIQLIDAWGKIPSGILYEHLVEIGNFDECVSVTHSIPNTSNDIHGKYCLADISIGQILNATEIPKLQIGICLPAACKAEELRQPLEELLAKILNSTTIGISNDAVLLKDTTCLIAEKSPFEPIDWAAIGVSTLIVMLMVMSTIYDYLLTYHEKPLHPLLGSFSVRANIRQLFHISTHMNAPHIIPCLHGMRCLSIIWIICIHTNMMLSQAPNINNIELTTWNRTPFSALFQAGTVAVDTFFFLSGLLVIMVSFREMEKNAGRINVPKMYLHRFLRLTPVLALAVLLCMSITRYIGTGPFRVDMNQQCKETWWATILYVQNYAAAGKMCLGHSWYLAVDMQLYWFSPLVLIAIWKWKRKGLAGILVIGLLFTACLFCIIVINKMSVLDLFNFLVSNDLEMRQIYYSTHSRVTPWIVGIAIGYYLHCRAGRRSILSKAVVVIGWLGALALLYAVLFALHPKKQLDATSLTSLEGAFYLSLTRIAWPLALAWIVFACVNGYGGIVNHLLSSSLWQPLSKLSYCLYIWHLEVVYINAGRIKTNSYLSDYDGILRFWSNFGISLLVALLMYLAIESPMLGIDKFLFSKSKAKPKSTDSAKVVAVSQQNLCDP